jgi:2,4-dienoyl-CoA reductase-like NADH-dependent reductase (Old Yellow Enzyme family)/thioredoxin reductase
MDLIKRLMGRRQFLITAGLASTCALTCKKLAGFFDRNSQAGAAMASERAVSASLRAAGNRCPHLLSPLRIRNVVLKNRIFHSVSPNFIMQGPERYPTDTFRNHYTNMAKNAAIVTMNTCFGKYPKTYYTKDEGLEDWLFEALNSWDQIGQNKWEDIPPAHNYIERMIDDIHTEGALILFGGNTGDMEGIAAGEASGQNGIVNFEKAAAAISGQSGMSGGRGMPGGGEGRGGMPGGAEGGRGGMPGEGRGPMGGAGRSVEEIVAEAKEVEDQGYDVYQMRSPSLEAVQAVRNSTNLIIMTSLNLGVIGRGSGPNIPGVGNVNQPTKDELEQAVEQVRQFEGLADFVYIRAGSAHPNSFCQDKDRPWSLAYAEAIKKAGIKILTCPGAGFHDPVQNDKFIADGLTDMISMTTPFFADPELVRKVAAGRADDVIPCYQCQNCHCISMLKGPHFATCDVNPKWATPAYKLQGITAPKKIKKVAVIGGGPGGMKAALVAAERGHEVTLFEKDAALGGLIKFSDYSQWRWNMKDLKDYLIHQVNKAGIEVKVKTAATPSMIKAAGYDTVLVAVGAKPVESRMKGADADNVFNILTCYSNKKALGKNVVMIGAGKIGTEAAIGIAKDGHKITVLASGDEMIDAEDVGAHNVGNQERIYKNHPNLEYVMKTMVKSITGGKVIYRDEKGAEHSIQADSIVIWSGLKPRMDEAEKFMGSADEVLFLGDCTGKGGRIQKTLRNAFFVASQV